MDIAAIRTTETDFISREVAISEILSDPTDAHYPSWYAEKLKHIPAADVVEVVRCGECRERTSGRPFCQGRPKDWFCANGVRWTK